MKISGIYKIQSQVKPERIYIGSAVDVSDRWNTHLRHLRKNKHHSPKLQYHYNKYGESDLVFIIIEPCFSQFLLIREQYYINTLKSYFNVCMVAGSRLGIKLSKEAIEKNRIGHLGQVSWMKGKKHSLESRKKISAAGIGRKASEETKKKRKESDSQKGKNHPMFGRHHSEETNIKISKANKGNIAWNKGNSNCFTDETRQKMRSSHLGKIPWNKGKANVYSDEMIKRISEATKKGMACKKLLLQTSLN